jgi:hypothetical protein
MSDEIPNKPPRNKPGPKKGTKLTPEQKAGQRPYYADEKWPPAKKGAKKRGPLDWSLDELIEYKAAGGQPMRIPNKEMLFALGRMGVTISNAAELFDISESKFMQNLDWLENWQKGSAECKARIRASIVDDALHKDILNAKLYLDKIWATDKVRDEVNVNVRSSELNEIDTSNLLEVLYKTQLPNAEKDSN